MAYQTRTRSSRPGVPQATPEANRQPQIVYMTQTQQNQKQTNQTAANYVTSTLTQQQQQQTAMQTQQQQNAQALPPILDADAGYEDIPDGSIKTEEDGSRPKWMKKRKDPSYKVSKKVRRKRMNAKLRRILQPKNAIMVLNELKESVKFTFTEQTNAMQQNYFLVTVEVDGQNYSGQGSSKPAAKQNAAENALKALLLEKMAQNASGADSDGDVAMKEDNAMEIGAPDVPPGEEPPLLDEEGKPMGRQNQQPEDDVPWGSLASFALFKLFSDWQSQGTTLPMASRSGGGGGGSVTSNAAPGAEVNDSRGPAPMKKLPDNPTDRHPVMLLNQLRPALVFNDVSVQGVPPNVTFTVAVTLDDMAYQGMGKNKKEAKKEAAKAALAAVYNIHYDN